jgi:sodium-dependent dicarboxylate transporter 2/3/5
VSRPAEPDGTAPATRLPEGIFGALEISSPKRAAIFFACGIVALVLALLVRLGTDLHPAAIRALFVLVFAALLWVSEAIPAYAVGILVIGLKIALLGRPEGVYAQTSRDWEEFVVVIGHPLV